MERKNSSEGGKKESGKDGDDSRARKRIGTLLELLKKEDPENLGFLDDDPNVMLEDIKRKHRKTKEEGSSTMASNKGGDEELQQEQQSQPQEEQPDDNDDDAVAVLPLAFQEKIQELNGEMEKLVIQKKLTETDLNTQNDRFEFSVPESEITNNFLTQEDLSWLVKNKGHAYILLSVLDPSLTNYEMRFKKSFGNSTNNVFYLTPGWNDIVNNNHLQLNDTLQLWSFRVSSMLWFAFVKL